ncbi:MAG: hypothetical protein RLQ12_08390 [Cyclobacteriaceae bacterium]
MAQQEEGLKDQISEVLEKYYTDILKDQLSQEVKFMNELLDLVNSFYATPATERTLFSNLAKYKAQLRVIFEDRWQEPKEEKEFTQQFHGFEEAVDAIFSSLPYSKVKEQKPERFFSQKEDYFFLKISKLFKRSFFFISKVPVSFANLFRKSKQKKRYWKHKILVRNLAKYHLQSKLILDLKSTTDLYFTTLTDMYLNIKLWEEQLINVEIGQKEVSSGEAMVDVEKKL